MIQADIETFYRRYGAMLYHRALAILGSEDGARRVMQDAILFAIRSGLEPDAGRPTLVSLFQTSTSLCLDRVRSRGPQAAPTTRNVPFASVLGAVPENLRTAATYFFIDALSVDEIADLLEEEPALIANRLDTFRAAVTTMHWEPDEETGSDDDPTRVA